MSNLFTEYVALIFPNVIPRTTISRQKFVFYIKRKHCIFFIFYFLGIHKICFKLSRKEIYWTMIVLFLFFSSRILHPFSSISQNANYYWAKKWALEKSNTSFTDFTTRQKYFLFFMLWMKNITLLLMFLGLITALR